VKTRADHRCFGCGDVIPKGSIAHVDCNVEGNQIYSLYLHPECKAIIDDIPHDYFYDNEIPEGTVREYLNDIGFEGTPEEYHKRDEG